jgi:hypothetical protein
MDHLLSRPGVVSATNKDSITLSRCVALFEVIKFNMGSWMISLFVGGLAYCVALQDYGWEFDRYPKSRDEWIQIALFSGPAVVLAMFAFVVPIILNPYVLGWPFHRQKKKPKRSLPSKPSSRRSMKTSNSGTTTKIKKDALGRPIVDINTFIDHAKELDREIERAQGKADVELGSLATRELGSPGTPSHKRIDKMKQEKRSKEDTLRQNATRTGGGGLYNIPENGPSNNNPRNGSSHRRGNTEV